jgi:hypothetical protein
VANVRTPRSAWIEAAQQALGAGGPAAIRIEASRDASVAKRLRRIDNRRIELQLAIDRLLSESWD